MTLRLLSHEERSPARPSAPTRFGASPPAPCALRSLLFPSRGAAHSGHLRRRGRRVRRVGGSVRSTFVTASRPLRSRSISCDVCTCAHLCHLRLIYEVRFLVFFRRKILVRKIHVFFSLDLAQNGHHFLLKMLMAPSCVRVASPRLSTEQRRGPAPCVRLSSSSCTGCWALGLVAASTPAACAVPALPLLLGSSPTLQDCISGELNEYLRV
jgi:hypothetical protein